MVPRGDCEVPKMTMPGHGLFLTFTLLAVPLGGCLAATPSLPRAATKPVSLQGPTVGNVTASTAQIRYVVEGNPGETSVQHREKGGVDWTLAARRNASGPVRVNLDGLSAGSSYEVRVLVDGTPRSDAVRFTTLVAGTEEDEAPPMGTKEARVYPGVEIWIEKETQCTLAFVLRSSVTETVYALTAGHCVRSAGDTIYINVSGDDLSGTGTAVGEVERFEDEGGTTTNDWALIRIYEEMIPHVSPAVAHWTGPTGVSHGRALAEGDRVCQYGHSEALTSVRIWDRHRCGSFDSYTEEGDGPLLVRWRLADVLAGGDSLVLDPTWAGDSGGPVIDYASGKALAIHHGSQNVYWNVGSAVYGVMDILEEGGYDLELVTAEYDPPPADWY